MPTVAAILGSAFAESVPEALDLEPEEVETAWGTQTLYRVGGPDRSAYVLFRHGLPHRRLPNQINYRAQAAALKQVGCEALLVTSSVGVVDPDVPINRPLLVEDLLMLENRLPDGSACTMFAEPADDHGHLVLDDSLFATRLAEQVRGLAEEVRAPIADTVTFAYVQGPRSKTAAENRALPRLGGAGQLDDARAGGGAGERAGDPVCRARGGTQVFDPRSRPAGGRRPVRHPGSLP
jgi:Purine nucleoside phosphorylase